MYLLTCLMRSKLGGEHYTINPCFFKPLLPTLVGIFQSFSFFYALSTMSLVLSGSLTLRKGRHLNSQQIFFTEIMTQLLKIIHKSCFAPFHTGAIFFPQD